MPAVVPAESSSFGTNSVTSWTGHLNDLVGTRGSALAVAQAAEVASRLRHAHQYLTHLDIELIPIRTTGDRIQDRPLAAIGGKGLFVREIERALLACEIDLAVHSMKDLEPELAPGTTIAAMLPRADPHDCLVPPGVSGNSPLAPA